LPPCPYFRKTFTVYENLRKATLYVSALGLFEISINGKRAGRDHFMPGWTNYSKRVYYKAYPVTDLVLKGENVIGAVLSNGWYAGYVGFAPRHIENPRRRAFYGEIPGFIAQLDLEYADGKRVTILTDRSWKASTGPIREADIQMGETYDARLEMPGWDRPFFDDRAWASAEFHDAIAPRLEAYPADPVRRIQTIQPVDITQPRPGVYVFNMGQNFAGYARIKIRGQRGTRIVLRYAEMLNKDGSVMTENLRDARATDTYYLKGDDSGETWQPRFTYHGFQYVEVSGLTREPDLNTVTGIVLHSSLAKSGSFECSSDLVNHLYRNIVWTQRSNFFDIPTDCPQRDERLGWSGDAQIYARSAAYNMDIAAFMSKWLIALEDDQRPSGAFPDFAPMPFLQFEPSPGWMDAGVICTYILYKVYGDTRIIKKHYRAMKRFMDYLERTSTNYLRFPKGNCWGDWQALGAQTPQDLIATAYYAYDARLMAEMASVIGNGRDSGQYSLLADNIKNAFSQAYVTSHGRVKGDTQTAYALAIYMKLLPDKMIGVAGERLVELIKKKNWHISTGFLGVKHILPALSETGHSAVACRLLENRTYPSWGYSIANGATTVWERWDSYTKHRGFENPEMNSFSHYAFGSVCEWMFSSMAGIDTDGAGFKRIIIRPRVQGCRITF
ncbi:MAG: family 78 glycoside hydrolase catalytic domain, partial [Deltaproteobacteria bacterium]|nr:family 78 glycoside hydrolase catalytic domain [Deltaproteobacteria bacterium]